MDVSLWISRLLLSVICVCFFISCGDRYDLQTERGRRSRIDDANYHLSKGECVAAGVAIDPLFYSTQVTDEVRILKASVYACTATFNFLTLAGNLPGTANFFQAAAKSMRNSAGDGALAALYSAVDVLTNNGSHLDGEDRTRELNNFMVFLQLGILGAIERNYGSPLSDGSQGVDMDYDVLANPVGEMSNLDACATAAALSFLNDSFNHSSLNDSSSTSLNGALNSICVGAGLSSCSQISRDRTSCDGTNANSVTAEAVVSGINVAW